MSKNIILGDCCFNILESDNQIKWVLDWEKFIKISGHYNISFNIEINNLSPMKFNSIELFVNQSGPAVLKNKNTILSASSDWTKASITLLDRKEDGLEGALIAAIMTHLSTRNGLMLHSSLVDFDGKGIMFVGLSGIGKTTQAELWMKYRDAVIINGDMALIREEEAGFTGYGCPWHGSSPYCENRQVPLCGIIVLEQAKENRTCLIGTPGEWRLPWRQWIICCLRCRFI